MTEKELEELTNAELAEYHRHCFSTCGNRCYDCDYYDEYGPFGRVIQICEHPEYKHDSFYYIY